MVACLDPQSTRERHNAMVTLVDGCMRKDQVGTLLAECSGIGVRATLCTMVFSADHSILINRMPEWRLPALGGAGSAD